jgi:hypothetical protein
MSEYLRLIDGESLGRMLSGIKDSNVVILCALLAVVFLLCLYITRRR